MPAWNGGNDAAAQAAIGMPGHHRSRRVDRGEASRVDVEREHPLELAARRPRIGGAERVDRHRAVGVLDARAPPARPVPSGTTAMWR